MKPVQLSLELANAANDILRPEIGLMDNHVSAPGYILFPRDNQGVSFMAYLTYKPTSESKIPFVYGFELRNDWEREQIRQAIIEAQDTFLSDIATYRHIAKREMSPVVGEKIEPVKWVGGSLKHFGMNPHGEERYRIVLAPTRLWLVGGVWAEREDGKANTDSEGKLCGVAEYRWIPRYGEDEGWILEKWLSPEEYGGSREGWEIEMRDPQSGLLELGPYPVRGEFEACWRFATYPPISAVEQKIQEIEASHKRWSMRQRTEMHRQVLEQQKRAREGRLKDFLGDALPAFPGKVISGSPYRSAPDPLRFTTKDLPEGMPEAVNDFKQMN